MIWDEFINKATLQLTLKDGWDFNWKYVEGYSRWREKWKNNGVKAKMERLCLFNGEWCNYPTIQYMLVTEMSWTPMLEPYLQRAERPCKKEGLHLKGYNISLTSCRKVQWVRVLKQYTAQTERRTMLLHSLFLLCCLFCFVFPIILLLHYYSSFCPSFKECNKAKNLKSLVW